MEMESILIAVALLKKENGLMAKNMEILN